MGDGLSKRVYRFSGFRLDARRRMLLADGGARTVAIGTKAFDTLLHLVEHAGEVVSKAALLRAAWPDVVVEENNLSQCVSALRRALGEDPASHRFIVTVPGRGYRFIAEIEGATAPKSATSGDRPRGTENPLAYQSYVNGWSALTRPGGGNLEQGLLHLERATRLDPDFALAYVCMADGYALLGVFGLRAPHDVFPHARAAVLKALAIDPDLAEAHAELGHIQSVYDLDGKRALLALRRALELDPRSALAHHYVGLAKLAAGELDEAFAAVRRAQEIEPLAANINANIGMVHYYARRYDDAIAQLDATLELDRTFDHARSYLGRALARRGDFDRAIEEFLGRSSRTIGDAADLPATLALRGDATRARAELARLLAERSCRYVSAHSIATVYAALDDKPAALDWLEHALEERAQPINFAAVDPAFDGLAAEPRFRQVLARLHRGPDT
jgi:DNA-binding winged helix-turn-helix (wHTH) protein/Tfp pilus assembly protein PilF